MKRNINHYLSDAGSAYKHIRNFEQLIEENNERPLQGFNASDLKRLKGDIDLAYRNPAPLVVSHDLENFTRTREYMTSSAYALECYITAIDKELELQKQQTQKNPLHGNNVGFLGQIELVSSSDSTLEEQTKKRKRS